jgi:hypothetical protein
MIGTADVRWAKDRPMRFDVQWTTRDSATGRSILDRDVRGVVDGGILRISGSKPDSLRIPAGPWAVVDFGMDEQLIPLLRTLPANGAPLVVSVFRPWHGRWDTVTVTVRDTASVRVGEVVGTDKLHEVMVLTARDDLLSVVRYDRPAERRPLEGSTRYGEYLAQRDLLLAIAKRYRPRSALAPQSP